MIKTLLKKTVRKSIKKLIPSSTFENLRIQLKDFHAIPPIIVYTMGKVGSSTVYATLQNANPPNPIYHVHFLSHDGIKKAEKYHLRSKRVTPPHHIQLSKALRKKIDKAKGVQWQIIALVREPISRDISDLFQNIKSFYPHLIDENGNIRESDCLEFLQKMFMNYNELTDYACTWFDRELKSTFKVDVYAHPFNHGDGFTIIRDKNTEVLILRLEDMNYNLSTALTEFLNIDMPIQIVKSNIGENKQYSAEYKDILANILIPKSVCYRIYSSRYAKHFYSESMREVLVRRWSRK